VDTTARWRIVDPLKFLKSVATESGAQSRLGDIIDSMVRDLVAANPLVEMVRSSAWEPPKGEVLEEVGPEILAELKKEVRLGREGISQAILTAVQKVTPEYGIEVIDVRIKRLNYVESVREKVYVRMISERKRIAARFRSEGEGRSAEILGNMEKELREIRSVAYRKVQEIRGKGDAEATRVYGGAYGRDPEFYAFSRTLESLKESQNKNAVLVLTTNSDYYRYLKEAQPSRARR
jgi:membrane protease subunit HflC